MIIKINTPNRPRFAPETTIAVDTNVLLWTFYQNITYANAYQKNIYSDFLSNIIRDKHCSIHTTIFNIFEIFNVIENTEYEIYVSNNKLDKDRFKKKDYRKLTLERNKNKEQLDLIYRQISECMSIDNCDFTEYSLIEYKDNFNNHMYDIFDFSLLKFCRNKKINYILTDDADFTSYKTFTDKMNFLTANNRLK